ncbi:hypothetical protein HII31_08178 [Pseudocercospora fuligena]|uniref:Uncharacterized protein n=1 Tax=Pseudocercospora fuligena TaxID=685502 RepID=A0A8H6RF93_9PEZI|nr:hypothetical protein HII31_08178 [Pseudocercospora fuligena]
MSEARSSLDELSIEILGLESLFRASPRAEHGLFAKQMRLRDALDAWLSEYNTLLRPEAPTVIHRLREHSILSQYAILQILLATSLQPSTDTGAFDSHTSSLLDIIFHSIQIQILVFKSGSLRGTPFAHKPDVPKFSIDGFSIVPLFYTAIHCRHRYLRRQAVRLMKAAGSREAMWDANLMATVAREVIDIEEKGLDPLEERDGEVYQVPELESLGDMIPIKQRLWSLQITLPNGPWDRTVIECQRLDLNGHEEVISRVYDPMERRWSSASNPPITFTQDPNPPTPSKSTPTTSSP